MLFIRRDIASNPEQKRTNVASPALHQPQSYQNTRTSLSHGATGVRAMLRLNRCISLIRLSLRPSNGRVKFMHI